MMSVLLDSYSDSNYDYDGYTGGGSFRGQSFTNLVGSYKLASAKFYMYRSGTPTGAMNMRAVLYEHSGVYGTSSIKTGSALATSSDVLVSSIGETIDWVTFTFDGTYSLTPGAYYCIEVELDADATGQVVFGIDATTPTHSGNYYASSANNARDLIFEVYGDEDVPEIPDDAIVIPTFVEPIVKNIFQKSRYEEFKYELLSLQDGEYLHAGWITDYIINANVSANFTRDIVSNANFNIRNNTDINYLSDLIRPYYVLNSDYNYPLGTYMLSAPTKKSDGMLVSQKISAFDLLLALDQDKTITSTSYALGSNVITTVKSILDSVGTWVNYDINDNSEVLATDVSYELGKSKLFIINSLLNMINYYSLWADGNGVFRAIPWSNDINTCYEFEDNELSIYKSGVDLELDFTNIYNRVVVITNQLNADTAPFYKVWTLEDEGLSEHPFSYTSLGRYVTKIFNSDAVSQDYVDLRARRELLKMLELEESVNYNHAFITSRNNDGLPWQNDGYRFKNTLLDVDSIYKLESMTYSLEVGSLVQTKIKRIRSTY